MDGGIVGGVPAARPESDRYVGTAGQNGSRVLELRVHGVSNTPPADLLGLTGRPGDQDGATAILVAGDTTTGFYRSSKSHPRLPGPPFVVEAYSWGQLTSGVRAVKDIQRALWTLLLPFMLGNVALHARPDIPPLADKETLLSRAGMAGLLVRLLCLSLTATLILGATGVGVDLFAWQCVDQTCLGQIPGPWEFLATGWWHEAGRALVVGLLVPFAVLGLIGLLTWRSYQYEAVMPSKAPGAGGPRIESGKSAQPEHPMQQPTFWCGEGQVRRLAVVHLTTGAAAALVVPVVALYTMDQPGGARAWYARAILLGLAVLLALAVVALASPYVTRRTGDATLGAYGRTLIGLCVVLVVAGVVYLLLPIVPGGPDLAALRPPSGCALDSTKVGCSADRSLPGYDWVLAWLATGQVMLIVAIAGVSRSGRRTLVVPLLGALLVVLGNVWSDGRTWGDRPRWGVPPAPEWLHTWHFTAPIVGLTALVIMLWPRSRTVRSLTARDVRPEARLAWGGRGPAVFAGLGWALCLAYSAGVLYWVTDLLNRGATPTGVSSIRPPVPMMWTGLALVVSLAFMLVGGVTAYGLFARLRRKHGTTPAGDLSAHERRRARDVATFQALHDLVGTHALRIVGFLAAGGLFLAVLGTSAAMSNRRPVGPEPRGPDLVLKAFVDVGDGLAALLPLVIAGLGALVYRNDRVRRWVGVVWDVGTFWPRSAHPLAPPSYAELAVPQLQTRTRGLLHPESEPGSEPKPEPPPDLMILAGHSQGAVISAAVIMQMAEDWRGRVYFFSFGCQLTRLYGRAFPAYFGPKRLPVLADMLCPDREVLRWTNFHRDTDPLGWKVHAGQKELWVKDPVALRPKNGEVIDPPIGNHSGYPDTEEYAQERRQVTAILLAPAESPILDESPQS